MRGAGGLLFLLALMGCDPFAQPDRALDEYLSRLERTLDESVERQAIPTVVAMPRRRDRVLDLPEVDISLLDFLALYGCELQYVIGERTSSMGRVMHPGSRLEYEVRFLHTAADCLDEITSDSRRERLEEAMAVKREGLPLAIWNGTWGTQEIESLFSRSQGPLPMAVPSESFANLRATLGDLERLLDRLEEDPLPERIEGLDRIYQRWQAEALAGQLLRSAHLLTTRLDDAARLIHQRLDRRPLCPEERPNQQADVANNVLMTVFMGEIQPYLAEVQRQRQRTLPLLEALLVRQVDAGEERLQEFYQRNLRQTGTHSAWQALDQAVQRHTDAWARLLAQCGMTPGDI